MGVTINIIDAWEEFKAARTAIYNIVQTSQISLLASSRAIELQVTNIKKIYTYTFIIH